MGVVVSEFASRLRSRRSVCECNPAMISANLNAMWSSEIATARSQSTPSVIVMFNVLRNSSALTVPKMLIEGRRRQRETPAKAMMK